MPLDAIGWFLENLSDLVVVPSNHLRDTYSRRVRPEKIHRVYNGVELEEFDGACHERRDQLRSSVREEFGISHSERLICSVGHPGPEKGWMDLLKAASLLSGKRKDFRFLVVGPVVAYDTSFRCLRKVIKELRLQDRIIFTGFRRDVQKLMAASDIVFQPSRMETFSLVAAEAMGQSVPVVGTLCGGMEEVIQANETGLMTRPGDHAAMAEALGLLIDNPDECERLGRNGRNLFLSNFSPKRYVEHFDAIYRKVMDISLPEDTAYDFHLRQEYQTFAELYAAVLGLGMQIELQGLKQRSIVKWIIRRHVPVLFKVIRFLWQRLSKNVGSS